MRSRQSHQRTKAALASAAEKSEVSLSAAPSETEELSWVGLLEANAQHEEEKVPSKSELVLILEVLEEVAVTIIYARTIMREIFHRSMRKLCA